MQLRLAGSQPNQKVFLFWRSASAPDIQNYMELTHDTSGESWHTLANVANWQGQVIELAIGVFGPPGRENLRLMELVFHPTGPGTLWRRLIWEWLRETPWNFASTNAHVAARTDAPVSPTLAASLWSGIGVGLAALGLLVVRKRSGRAREAAVTVGLLAILVPWVGLDYLWQRQLDTRLADIAYRYGGLTQAEKHRREGDAWLQAFADSVRAALEPLRGKRLFLVRDSDKYHDFQRLRLQFHLLPINVFSSGSGAFPAEKTRPGDHILLLGETPGMRFNAARSRLESAGQSVPVTLVMEDPLGRLFRVAPADKQHRETAS
jgi:hypothetical protein